MWNTIPSRGNLGILCIHPDYPEWAPEELFCQLCPGLPLKQGAPGNKLAFVWCGQFGPWTENRSTWKAVTTYVSPRVQHWSQSPNSSLNITQLSRNSWINYLKCFLIKISETTWDLQPKNRARVQAGAVHWTSCHKRVLSQNKWFFCALHRSRKHHLHRKSPLSLSYLKTVTETHAFIPPSKLNWPLLASPAAAVPDTLARLTSTSSFLLSVDFYHSTHSYQLK